MEVAWSLPGKRLLAKEKGSSYIRQKLANWAMQKVAVAFIHVSVSGGLQLVVGDYRPSKGENEVEAMPKRA